MMPKTLCYVVDVVRSLRKVKQRLFTYLWVINVCVTPVSKPYNMCELNPKDCVNQIKKEYKCDRCGRVEHATEDPRWKHDAITEAGRVTDYICDTCVKGSIDRLSVKLDLQ